MKQAVEPRPIQKGEVDVPARRRGEFIPFLLLGLFGIADEIRDLLGFEEIKDIRSKFIPPG